MSSLLQVQTLPPLPSPSSHRFPSRPMTSLRVSRVKPVKSLSSSSADTGDVPLAGHRAPLGSGATESATPRSGDGGEGISGIHVPRQKYISVSKIDLLNAILSTFESEDEAREFALFARCLDSVLHAENKALLEEMREYYSVSCLCETDEVEEPLFSLRQPTLDGFAQKMGINMREVYNERMRSEVFSQLNVRNMFGESLDSASERSWNASRVAAATRFQQAFLKLLKDAQFEEISAQDLLLARALNTDYLLTLPIYVDWKKALQSNAVIFRRGYTAEGQKGMLLAEKLDYLQANLLQGIFSLFSKPVKEIGIRISEVLKQSNQVKEIQDWIERVKAWLAEPYLPQNMMSYAENRYINWLENNEGANNSLPIWLAAQKAVPLYEGLLSDVGPRGRLMRKLLTWIGLTPSVPEMSLKLDADNNNTEAYLRPTFLPRVTLSDIWKPATKESCGNNLWKVFKTGLSIIFSQSYLQEPAFQELILLYTEDLKNRKSDDKDMFLPLQLEIYERISIPDLPVIFPHKKLSFRILDTIRLDAASILGLLAFLVNYKFETVISSPSAFLLDLIAVSALIIYATRVGLGYKQTWDRYQLLVNKTLYEKTLASGFGSVHFLLDASEQQQYKEAILAFAVLQSKIHQVHFRGSIKDSCERFLYKKFKEKVEMPIDNAIETLLKLKIVTEHSSKEQNRIEALSSMKACNALKIRWDLLLTQEE